MRFRRKAKLFPGVYLNFSKTGISTTIGIPGASVNLGNKGAYLNTGIPGTGLYDRKRISVKGKANQNLAQQERSAHSEILSIEWQNAIESGKVETITSKGLQELKETLLDCHLERIDLKQEISKAKRTLRFASVLLLISYIMLFGFFISWFRENKKDKETYLADLKTQLENCFINIDMDIEASIQNKYQSLQRDYGQLLSCEKIWDITAAKELNAERLDPLNLKQISRKEVQLAFGDIDIIKSKQAALHFENANGGDLYIYPAFLLVVDTDKNFGLIDIRELNFDFQAQKILEEEAIPKDAFVSGKTWAKVNKDGSRDKRFKENQEIAICKYALLKLNSRTGLNEAYMFSSFEKSEKFSKTLLEYQEII